MRFIPLPRSAAAFAVIAMILLLAWAVWGTYKYPEALWAPGDLSRFHADITDCAGCHRPFRGPATDRCVSCHDEKYFASGSRLDVSEFHRKAVRDRAACRDCHTEHRGALAQITRGAMANPHGEFVFRATGTASCSDCHDLGTGTGSGSFLLDNAAVRHLMEEGEGAHRAGNMANCLGCHRGGRLDIEEDD